MDDSRVSQNQPALPFAALRLDHSLGVFLVALSVFLLLPQRTLHGVDGDVFVAAVEQGQRSYPRHIAFLHVVGFVHSLCRPLGQSAYQSLLLTSALGSALAAVFLHRMFRLLSPRPFRSGRAPALAALTTGPCFYYATCAEIHGVFAAGAAASWWALARLLHQPSLGRAVALGLATGLAASVHAFGHVLLPTVAAAAFLYGAHRRGVAPWWVVPAGAVHVATAALVAASLGGGCSSQAADALAYLGAQGDGLDAWMVLEVLVREWLAPCAPWSLCALVGLCFRRSRLWSLVALSGLFLHLPVAALLLGQHRIDEGGAYLLAVVPAAVLAATRLFRFREFALLTVAGAALSCMQALPQWQEPAAAEFVAGVRALDAQQKLALVVGRRHELDGVRIGLEGAVVLDLVSALHVYLEQRQGGKTLGAFFADWQQTCERAGRALCLSQSAVDLLEQTPEPEFREFWQDEAPGRFALAPVACRGFQGVLVTALPAGGGQ